MVHLSFELLLYRPKQYIANMLDIFPILCQNTIRFCSATCAILVCATEHPHTAVFIAPYYAYTVQCTYSVYATQKTSALGMPSPVPSQSSFCVPLLVSCKPIFNNKSV